MLASSYFRSYTQKCIVILGHSDVPYIIKAYIPLYVPLHDDAIKWKHFPLYWSFVREIHRSPGEFPAQRPVTRSFHAFLDQRLNKPLSKQSWGWWFETLQRPLWRHSNGIAYLHDFPPQCFDALMFSVICAWINGWVNNRQAIWHAIVFIMMSL